ncbi:MAG: hypothetical protein ASARMPREDX12_002763 [Alectoria sarmentosa]|nr:MAG: hypothetical protein ASARMPREDX12_002763 [Alectoria sarmentosa]
MLALQRISDWILDAESEDISPLPSPTPPRSRFESLPTELRLGIYSLLLSGKPEYCHFEKCDSGRSYSIPRLYPAILAVNRSISAEAYPILYGENTFLFLGTTRNADDLQVHYQLLGRRAGLPKLQKPSLLPEQSRHLIKHVAAAPLEVAKYDWVGRLLKLAPAVKTVDFDFWVGSFQRPDVLGSFTSISTLTASVPAIKSLINASTQTFRIGARDINAYYESGFRFSRRKRVELPGMKLAVVDLRGLDNMQEKSRLVHKALSFIIEIMGQRPPMPSNTNPPGQALVSVEKRLLVHRDFAGFWSSDEFTVTAEIQGWNPVDTNGQSIDIGRDCKRAGDCLQTASSVENYTTGNERPFIQVMLFRLSKFRTFVEEVVAEIEKILRSPDITSAIPNHRATFQDSGIYCKQLEAASPGPLLLAAEFIVAQARQPTVIGVPQSYYIAVLPPF